MPRSSDIVLDIVLTTQDLQHDVEEMHVGAYSNDNTTNSRVPYILTSALEQSVSKRIIHNVEDEMPSHAKRDVDNTHANKLGSSRDSPVIQLLAPQEQVSYTHSEVINYSTKKIVDEMIKEGPTTSSAPNFHFMQQWLQHVQRDKEAKPSTSALLSEEELQALYGE